MVDEQTVAATSGTNLARFSGGDVDGNTDLDVIATDDAEARLYVGQGGDANDTFVSGPFDGFVDVSEAVLPDIAAPPRAASRPPPLPVKDS